jgi:HEAT repeat protein
MRSVAVAVVAWLVPLPAQQPACRDLVEIAVPNGDGVTRYVFQGTGTHVAPGGRKVGEFRDGVYTCWHRDGWKHVEVAFAGGVRLTTFAQDGAPVRTLRSESLAPGWHANGRLACNTDGGRVRFWDEDGTVAGEARLCQQIWRAWGTEVEVDERDVWRELLFTQTAPAVLRVLVDGLGHRDDWVRAHACAAVGTLAPAAAAAVPALRKALAADPFWLVRQRAAVALAELGTLAHEAVPELAAAVRDRDGYDSTRTSAALALGRIGRRGAAAVPALEEAAKVGPPALRAAAIEALGWIDPAERRTNVLLAELLADERHRQSAAEALWRRRHLAADVAGPVQAALAACGDEISAAAQTLAATLYHVDPKRARPRWHDDDVARMDAELPLAIRSIEPVALVAFCMLDADPDEIEHALDALTSCEDAWLRADIARHPATLGPDARAAVPGFVHLLSAGSTGVAAWAGDALAHIGEPAIPALLAVLRHERNDWSRDRHAVAALGAIGASATAALAQVLGSSPTVQAEAATALGRIGPAAAAALPALRQALASPRAELRDAAAEAIARIEGPRPRAPR